MNIKYYFSLTFFALIIVASLIGSTVSDRVKLGTYSVNAVQKPQNVQELQNILQTTTGAISIMGGNYSQGGQTICTGGVILDMSHFNKIISLDIENKTITVQPGITWRAIQKTIDPYNLSVKVMQSYNDFTVGGSLSVNVHARDLRFGAFSNTVRSFTMILADGSLITVSKTENSELFKAVIGGYGLLGIVTEITLELTENSVLEYSKATMSVNHYPPFFFNIIRADPTTIFHSALLWPPHFNTVTSVTWHSTTLPVTESTRLRPYQKYFPKNMLLEQLVRRINIFRKVRPLIENAALNTTQRVWRNYEMSYTVQELEPLAHYPSTTILQEYFIPVDNLIPFIEAMKNIATKDKVNIINIAIRHVPAEHNSLLTYAPQESFALVMYINIWNTPNGKKTAAKWTQKLIDAALKLGGTYYLPYQLYATKEQFLKAYPGAHLLRTIKNKYDPNVKFQNMLYKKYLATS